MKCLYSNSLGKLDCFYDQHIEVTLSKSIQVLPQKTFIFRKRPCLLSVIFIRRLQLKNIIVIVSRKFCLLQSYRFNRKLFIMHLQSLFLRVTFEDIYQNLFIRLSFYIYQNFIYHLFIYLFILFIHLFIYLFTYLFTCLVIYLLIYLFIHLFILLIYQIFIRNIFIKNLSGYISENVLYQDYNIRIYILRFINKIV